MNRVQRLKQRRKRKWITIAISACIVCIGIVIWYYISVQSPMWQERIEVKRIMLSESELAQIERVHKFVTEDVYHIATGLNANEELIFVSLSEDGRLDTFHGADGIAETDIREQHQKSHSDAKIERIRPGIWRGHWVWEVFYRKQEEEGMRANYDYYEMASGKLLETFYLRMKY